MKKKEKKYYVCENRQKGFDRERCMWKRKKMLIEKRACEDNKNNIYRKLCAWEIIKQKEIYMWKNK